MEHLRTHATFTVDQMIRDEPQHEKTNNVDSDQVWHKPGCAANVDG